MQEQLDRIEAKLNKLLERKSTRGSKRLTQAQQHDEAVAGYAYPAWLSVHVVDAWKLWCERRKEAKMYMTVNAIKLALAAIESYPDAVRIEALKNASMKPWASLHPESVRQQMPVLPPDQRADFGL